MILETPDSETMHEVNLEKLKRLARGEKLRKMQVTVQLFGHYSDVFAGEPVVLTLPPDSKLSDVVAALEASSPRLVDIAKHCRFALDEEYSSLDAPISDGAMVAVMPPMSGG